MVNTQAGGSARPQAILSLYGHNKLLKQVQLDLAELRTLTAALRSYYETLDVDSPKLVILSTLIAKLHSILSEWPR